MNINTALTTSTGWLRPARQPVSVSVSVSVCVPALTQAICSAFIPSAVSLAGLGFGEPWVQNSCSKFSFFPHSLTHTNIHSLWYFSFDCSYVCGRVLQGFFFLPKSFEKQLPGLKRRLICLINSFGCSSLTVKKSLFAHPHKPLWCFLCSTN